LFFIEEAPTVGAESQAGSRCGMLADGKAMVMSPASGPDARAAARSTGLTATDPFDPQRFRRVLGQYPTGVSVVTTKDETGTPVGMAVGSFNSVSLDPPLIAFFPKRESTTWQRIERARSFCVNILSADQEHLCRRFAAPSLDRFAGIGSREASSGSPIIDGVVAWIDCDIEFVHEAGDHYIVIGRVRELDIENASLPLLFYQGGYGRFAPHSLAVGNPSGLLTEQLRRVDLARPEMERIGAEIPGVRCTAITMQDEQLVITATAGDPEAGVIGSLVGQRLAFIPPLGTPFAAWMDGDPLERWLAHLPTESARIQERERLAAVRERGFSVSMRTKKLDAFTSALDRLADTSGAADDVLLRHRIQQLDHDPVELSDDIKCNLGSLAFPVFESEGRVAMILTVHGIPSPCTIAEADRWIGFVRSAAARASASLSRAPQPRSTAPQERQDSD
jgi:flavin reductase (DIM6/NTAB) family NADH-FMN oxidoreductase RutF/DNA-binding IclR family transcriptional regulator